MYAEEKPTLLPLPVEPFRYYEWGTRTVHLDGHVEVAGAYYETPPGRIWLLRSRPRAPGRSSMKAPTLRSSTTMPSTSIPDAYTSATRCHGGG